MSTLCTQFLTLDRIVIFCILAFSWWLMWFSFQYRDGEFIMLDRVWSDFGAHIPLIRSFSFGNNFPPEYPTFPGEPIRYHYLFFLVAGILEIIGFHPALALNIPSAMGMALLLYMIYRIGEALFNSKRAGVFAIILFLFNSSFSWVKLAQQSTNPLDFVVQTLTLTQYLTFGPWDGGQVSAFWNWNIFINQRHLALSFGLVLWLFYPLLMFTQGLIKKLSKLRGLGIFVAWVAFPLLHQAGYIMALILCGFWSLCFLLKIPKRVLLFYVWSVGISLIIHIFFTRNLETQAVFQIGFLAHEPTAISILWYWFNNLGLYLLLVPVAWLWAKPHIKLFFLPFILFFLLANLFRLSTDMINNHKLINFFIIGSAILIAGLLARISRIKRFHLGQLLVPVLLLPLTLSGLIDVFPIINTQYAYKEDFPKSEVQQWILQHSRPNDVFMSNQTFYNPASIVGRKLYHDYGYFNWSMGYDDNDRRTTQKQVLTEALTRAELCDHLETQHIDWILVSNPAGDAEYDFSHSTLLTLSPKVEFAEELITVYSAQDLCQPTQ